jgi:hypothetical protein
MIYRGPGYSGRMIRLLAHSLPVSKFPLFLSIPVCHRLLTAEGGKAWVAWARSQIIQPRENLALYKSFNTFWLVPKDGILGHQFNKRLESFASCFSQSLLLADFKESSYSTLVLIILSKKLRETTKLHE